MIDDPDLLGEMESDPDYFSRVMLGRRSTRDQRRFAAACDSHHRVNVRSGNGTGKTFRAGAKIVEKALSYRGSRTIITGPSYDQAYAGLWQDVQRAYEGSRIALPGKFLDSEWRLGTGWEVFVANPMKFSSVQGLRGHDGPTFVWIDEAHAVEDEQYWNALESICQDPESFICAMGNPLWPQGRFYANANDPRWCNVKLSCFTHPNVRGRPKAVTEEWARAGRQLIRNAVSREWIFSRLEKWGADDPNYIGRVEGEFPDAGELQLFPRRFLEASATARTGVNEEPRAGLDPARNPGTGDRNAFVIFDRTRRAIHCERWHDDDTMRVKDRYVTACKAAGVPAYRACVDVVGIGAGIIDQSKREGYALVPVNFGAKPSGGWKDLLGTEALHANLKAELFDAARHMARRGLLSFPAESRFRPVLDDLVEIRREQGGVMKIEDKDKTRKRIGRSPDYADAVAVSMYQGAFRAPTDAELRELARYR